MQILSSKEFLFRPFHILKNNLLTTTHREATDVGMKRLTLTDSDKQVRDWFVKTTESLGCKVSIDAMGTCWQWPAVSYGQTLNLTNLYRKHLCCTPRKEGWSSNVCRLPLRYSSTLLLLSPRESKEFKEPRYLHKYSLPVGDTMAS